MVSGVVVVLLLLLKCGWRLMGRIGNYKGSFDDWIARFVFLLRGC